MGCSQLTSLCVKVMIIRNHLVCTGLEWAESNQQRNVCAGDVCGYTCTSDEAWRKKGLLFCWHNISCTSLHAPGHPGCFLLFSQYSFPFPYVWPVIYGDISTQYSQACGQVVMLTKVSPWCYNPVSKNKVNATSSKSFKHALLLEALLWKNIKCWNWGFLLLFFL